MKRRTLLSRMAGLAALGAATLLTTMPSVAADKVVVFAAASLKNALDAASAAWTAEMKNEAAISYAASSALAKQIQEGAPANIFISADMDWMNTLAGDKLIDVGSVVQLLGNDIVLIVAKDSKADIRVEQGFDLAGFLGDGKLAMGDVKGVPAGKYGKAALEALGAWPAVESKVAMAENVRAALKLVATGEAVAGVVYATDAAAEPAVRIVGTFPAESHPKIIYPAGLVAASTSPEAEAFLAYLKGDAAQAIFKAQGFTVLPPAAN